MAEQSISIKIADRSYPLKVNSPEHEEVIRKAADDINRMISKYQERFPGKGMIEILSFVALNVCMSNITLNRQMKNLNDGEAALVKELEGYLENIDKKRREIEKIALSSEEQTGLNIKREELNKVKTRKLELVELIQQDDLRRQMLVSELNSVAQKLMDERIALTKIDTDLEYMQKHIEEEYGLTYESCLSEKDPEYNIGLSTQEMNRIKRRINNLGTINPAAIDEFNELRDRYDEYNRQRNDLEAAELDLKSVIKNITDDMHIIQDVL